LKLREKLSRGIFTTIVEVFPPTFSVEDPKEPLLGLRQKTRDLVARVRKVENLADAIMVSDLKDLDRLKLSSVFTAAILKEELGVEVFPVLTARDVNRPALRTTILTSITLGLDSMMLVWGDRFGSKDNAKNVYDYAGLADVISDVRSLSYRSDCNATIVAPVDLSLLESQRGVEMANSRLSEGADFLMAQPPTTDEVHTLGSQINTLDRTGLNVKVMLNVFPFRSKDDMDSCSARFGWKIPPEMDDLAKEGQASLLRAARRAVDKIRELDLSGVFVSTRGRPELARFILD
jgi:5,10-methylenetetrahydrofolate reductase